MKIEPKHDIMRPAYAIGVAVMAAALLTGCPGSSLSLEGEATTAPTSESQTRDTDATDSTYDVLRTDGECADDSPELMPDKTEESKVTLELSGIVSPCPNDETSKD